MDLRVAIRKLGKSFRLLKLILLGGGKFNGAMLRAGMVDEISHVTAPVADGGVGLSIFFDIPGSPPPKAAATLRLLSPKRWPGRVMWMRYRFVPKYTRYPPE